MDRHSSRAGQPQRDPGDPSGKLAGVLAGQRRVRELRGGPGGEKCALDAPLEREDAGEEAESAELQGLLERSADEPGSVPEEPEGGPGASLLHARLQLG